MNHHAIGLATLFLLSGSAWASEGQASATEEQVLAFRDAVASGERNAVRDLFALNADGAAAEDKDIILGGLVAKRPQLFLEELKLSSLGDCRHCLPGLLGNLGNTYVDRFDAEAQELTRRRNALLSVHDKALATLQDRCVRVLDREIKEVLHAAGDIEGKTP